MEMIVGHSADPWAAPAMDEVLSAVSPALSVGPPCAAIGFLSPGVDFEIVAQRLFEAYPGLPFIGCTTDGELSSALGFQEDSVGIAFLRFGPGVVARVGIGHGAVADGARAARAAVERAGAPGDPPIRFCLVLAESLGTCACRITEAVQAACGPDAVVVGGTAADQWEFQNTRQFFGAEVHSDAVVVLTLRGALDVSVGIESGWTPIGRPAEVTRSYDNIVAEIEGRPAMDWFRTHQGVEFTPNPEHPIAVHEEGGFHLRAPLDYSDEDGSIRYAGAVSQGAIIQLSASTRDEMLRACEASIAAARKGFPGEPEAALIVSCAARKQLLGTRTADEIRRFQAEISPTLPLVGFYGYGEIGPLSSGEGARFHNETFVTVLLGERGTS